ncbi:PAS domain-containing protein [Rhizobium sp. SG_E_25_P2]|nr:PAS domain-containing protein [Rhizobium sp. SG_E_25_P2]
MLLALDDGVETPLGFDKAAIGIASSEIVHLASAFRRFGVLKIDLSDGATYFSPQACAMHGLPVSSEPIKVVDLLSRIHPVDAERILDAFETAAKARCGWYFNYRLRQANGSVRWARLVEHYRDTPGGGEFVGIVYEFLPRDSGAEVLVSSDGAGAEAIEPSKLVISAATTALHTLDGANGDISREGLRHQAVDISDDDIADLICRHRLYGFFRQDIESGHCYFSQAAHQIYGLPYSPAPANLAELIRRTHPDDAPIVSKAFEAAARHKAMFHVIHRYARTTSYKTLRLIGGYRKTTDGKDELYGSVYEFYDNLSIAGFAS